MKKSFKKIFAIILSVISIVSPIMQINADTVLDTLNAYEHRVTAPISYPQSTANLIKATDGKPVYCLHFSKLSPVKSVKYTKGSLITDNGMNYILKQSYGKTSDNDIFIYKSALQLYMVDKGIMPGTYSFLTTYNNMLKNDNSEIAVKIKNLIAEAKKAGANDTSAPTISVSTGTNTFTLDSNKQYYVSNNITVNSSTGAYTASLTSAPEGSTIVKNGNTFVVKVPANKVSNLETTISFKVSNTKDIYTSYKYTPNNTAYQDLGVTYKDTKTASATGSLNLSRKATVPFLKVDAETDAAISGAELKLADSNGKVILTWTSATTAKEISLGEGSYTLTETKAPAGYKVVNATIKFSVDKQGNILDNNGKKITKVVISNEKKTGGVEISKQDITDKKELPGATLVIKDSKGKVVAEWVSTNKPYTIKKLTPGTYTLSEKIAPDGYILSEETISFKVKDDGSITKVVMYNTPKTGGVSVSKQDITNKKELPGATLVIKDSKGKVIDEWVSTDKPHYIEKLTPGTYTLTEEVAPAGYILSEETITFKVKDDGSITKVVMYNTPKTGGVSISKQDITNKEELTGATLVIKDSKGKVIDEWVSTNKPHTIKKLTPGTYTLTEKVAPEGYILSEETITFKVKDDGTVTKVVMYNTPVPGEEIPVEPTSSFKTMTSSILGTIIIMAGAYMIFKNSKKKELN